MTSELNLAIYEQYAFTVTHKKSTKTPSMNIDVRTLHIYDAMNEVDIS